MCIKRVLGIFWEKVKCWTQMFLSKYVSTASKFTCSNEAKYINYDNPDALASLVK